VGACRAAARGKRLKSAFFETCGQPPEEKEERKNVKIGLLGKKPCSLSFA